MTTASTGEKKLVFIDDNFGGHFWENGTYHNPASCSVCIAKQANSIPPHKEHGESWDMFKRRVFGRHSLLWNYSKAETIEEIEKYILSTQQEAVEEALAQRDDALIKKIKGMMKEVNDNSYIGEDTEFAYNEALYDVLSHLQETSEGK